MRVYSHLQDLLRDAVQKKGKPQAVGIRVYNDGILEIYSFWGLGNDFKYCQEADGEPHARAEKERADIAKITGLAPEEIPIEYHNRQNKWK